MMEITIKAEPKEIADLVHVIQSQQNQTVLNVINEAAAALIEKAETGDLNSFRAIKDLVNYKER